MNEEELKRLIEKYYNGTSTDEEEKALAGYGSAKIKLLQAMRLKRKYSAFYIEAGEMPEPSAGFEAGIIRAIDSSDDKRRSARFRRILVPLLSAAAGLLILAGSYFFFITGLNQRIHLQILKLLMLKQ